MGCGQCEMVVAPAVICLPDFGGINVNTQCRSTRIGEGSEVPVSATDVKHGLFQLTKVAEEAAFDAANQGAKGRQFTQLQRQVVRLRFFEHSFFFPTQGCDMR